MTSKVLYMVMVLVMEEGIVERTPGPWRRLLARLRSARLDRALAGGASPESGVAMALHAERLVRPESRRQLAGAVAHLSDVGGFKVPVHPDRLRAVQGDLDRVTGLLAGPGPVAATGVARLRLRLTDGTGPLFGRGSVEDLRRQLRQAADGLTA